MSLMIQNAIDDIIASIPGAPFPETVDVIKQGDAQQLLTGVVVTFLATCEVIDQAVRLGANLIISHEPVFYNHLDSTGWLEHHSAYEYKRRLIEENRLVIWRFHDYLHSLSPDSTVVGLLQALIWTDVQVSEQPCICRTQAMTLHELAQMVKERLGLPSVCVVGDMMMKCERVAVMPGFPGGEAQIDSLGKANADVLITGEIHEWEVSEYVRDATHLGCSKGLIVIGHEASEESGIRLMAPWLEERLPAVPVHFVPTGSPFQQV